MGDTKRKGFIFEIHPNLAQSPTAQIIFKEFQIYKRDCAPDEHALPSKEDQEVWDSVHPLFGRDRYETIDDKAREEENLCHVHLKKNYSIWENEEVGVFVQWDCTSDSYLIYSYFEYMDTHYYYVVGYLASKAHITYTPENQKYKRELVQRARDYRLKITGKT